MEFLLFVGVLVILFWVGSVSSRLSEVEKRLKAGVALPSADQESRSLPEHQPSQAPGFLQPKYQPSQTSHSLLNSPAIATSMPQTSLRAQAKPLTEAQQTELATNWLNKIGMVALLLGMVFFFKYAIDQGWINPWARIIIGFLVSGLLVYLGELWKEKYGSKAYALSGGGIALFYFSIFAAYQFYHIIPQPVAWVLMLIVAGTSIWLSFRYSSLTLGVLGFFGAYGSPLILSSGQDQQISLFIYLSIMNLVALIICLKKYWVELLFLGFLGTVVDYGFWANNYSNYQNTFSSVFFIVFSTLLIAAGAAALLRYHKEKNSLPEQLEKNLSALFIFAGGFYFFSLWILLNNSYHNFLAPMVLLGSVIFFFIYAVLDRLEYRAVNYCLSFVASGLLVSASLWQFDGKAQALALLGIALLGTSIGFLVKREELRVWGLIVLFMSLFKSLFEPYTLDDKVFLFNAKFGLMLANTLAMLFVGWLYGKFKATETEKNVEQGLQIVAAIILWLAVSWDMFSGLAGLGSHSVDNFMTFWWVIYPGALAAAAFVSRRKQLMNLALILLLASFIKVLILPYGDHDPLFVNAKFGLMLAQTLALFFVAVLHQKSENQSEASDVMHVVASLLFWFAVSWEIVQFFQGSQSTNARNLLLSLWWIAYAVILMVAGGLARKPVFRKVAIALFGLSILKVFLYDVQALDTPYRIIAFIVLGVILLSVSFAYQKNKETIVNFLEADGQNKLI